MKLNNLYQKNKIYDIIFCMMIKVSVIVPVYNTSKFLEKCLNSLINQTLQDIEIICINDGSTDNSLEILEKISKSAPPRNSVLLRLQIKEFPAPEILV